MAPKRTYFCTQYASSSVFLDLLDQSYPQSLGPLGIPSLHIRRSSLGSSFVVSQPPQKCIRGLECPQIEIGAVVLQMRRLQAYRLARTSGPSLLSSPFPPAFPSVGAKIQGECRGSDSISEMVQIYVQIRYTVENPKKEASLIQAV